MAGDDTIYRAWHQRLGHDEFRIRITMKGYGDDEDAADAFLDGLLETHPDAHPVISQNSAEDTITVTISFCAKDEDHASTLGGQIFVDGGIASGLTPGDFVRSELEVIGQEEGDAAKKEDSPRVYA